MRKVWIGLVFFICSVVIVSSTMTPCIYSLCEWIAPGAFPLRRIFNRVVMVSALFLCWLLAKYWEIDSLSKVGFRSFRPQEWIKGFALGFLTMGGLWFLEWVGGVRYFENKLYPHQAIIILFSAILIGFLEEILFRGFFFLALHPHLKQSTWKGLLVTSFFFSSVHFIQAKDLTSPLSWTSGWQLWAQAFPPLELWINLAPRWISLTLVGCLLCLIVWRKENLWEAMGWHTGWVLLLKLASALSERKSEKSFLFGEELFTGVYGILLLISLCLWMTWKMQRTSKIASISLH